MIVGTAGHIDHGKTALVKALTGVDADRLAEEKARGITIDLGFAYADLGGGAVTGFVDVPGHERLVHTMLAGAGGIDLALLVVAADDGVMPQTREHLAILDLLGLTRGIVAMTKADLADEARRSAVRAEIAAALAGTGLRDAPVLPVSAVTGEGVPALRAALVRAEGETLRRGAEGPFRLSVDRSFTIAGAGTIVTGTVLTGRVAVGDQVIVSPSGLAARVRGIHAQNRAAGEGLAGQRCALNLAGEGITKEAIHRGDQILTPDLHAPTQRIDAELRLTGSEARVLLAEGARVRLHSHAAEVGGRVVPLSGAIPPGGTGLVQLVLDRPLAAAVGDRFILRDASASRTPGGGRFLDLRAPARHRQTPARLAWLRAAGQGAAGVALAGQMAIAPVDLAAFARDRSLSPEAATKAAGDAPRIGPYVLSPGLFAGMQAQMQEKLSAFHAASPDLAGMGRERLRQALIPRLSAEVFPIFLRSEAAAKRIVLEGAFIRLPQHEVRLSEADEALFARILPDLTGDARFRPPRVRDFATTLNAEERDLRRVMKLAQRLGRVDEIAHDHFFARQVTAEMVGIARDVSGQAEGGWFPAAAFRDRMDNGRKVAIQILEFLDRHAVTIRRGDLRRINPRGADLFGP
ncbi:MAG: selenocysteine-specific translation elongation factor [Paracoccaceae bacterium]